jgi:hypothetical protein
MKKLKEVSSKKEMQSWLEKLENAKDILPAGEWTWWQCPACYHQGYHSGYHYRTMLRTPVEINGGLATVLRDLAVDKDLESFDSTLHDIWERQIKCNDFSKWMSYYVEPWQLIKAACLILKEKE